jgi:hypothetical protein
MQKGLLRRSLTAILTRYRDYERYLKYPGEWGERTFRAWLVFEIFHDYLRWPIPNIVFGEVFDTLFVNDTVKPIIYLETKKPQRGLVDLEAFQRHISKYQTLEWAILTDGYEWFRIDCVRKKEQTISLLKSGSSQLEDFFRALAATNYLYGVQNVKD